MKIPVWIAKSSMLILNCSYSSIVSFLLFFSEIPATTIWNIIESAELKTILSTFISCSMATVFIINTLSLLNKNSLTMDGQRDGIKVHLPLSVSLYSRPFPPWKTVLSGCGWSTICCNVARTLSTKSEGSQCGEVERF